MMNGKGRERGLITYILVDLYMQVVRVVKHVLPFQGLNHFPTTFYLHLVFQFFVIVLDTFFMPSYCLQM